MVRVKTNLHHKNRGMHFLNKFLHFLKSLYNHYIGIMILHTFFKALQLKNLYNFQEELRSKNNLMNLNNLMVKH